MRNILVFIYCLLINALMVCTAKAFISAKQIGKKVAFLTAALIPPVLGNLLIIATVNRTIARVGYYIFFLGMNLVMISLLEFTKEYCHIESNKKIKVLVVLLLIVDSVSLLCNPILNHAFTTTEIIVNSMTYHKLVPMLGQTMHRVIDYSIFGVVLFIFIKKTREAANIYAERYRIILYSMIVAAAWQTFYILTGSPVDRSMLGFAAFGIAVYYFSLIYRPMRLMDRMLANIASDIAQSVFFFDPEKNCIWINEEGEKLIDHDDKTYEKSKNKLKELFPEFDLDKDDWQARATLGTNGNRHYYKADKRSVRGDTGKYAGSFLLIKDITEEQKTIKRELYEATHDSLTDLYTKEYLYKKINEVSAAMIEPYGQVHYIDIDNFKMINDIYGKEFGDAVLQKVANWLRGNASQGSIYGRIGADIFGVFIPRDVFAKEKIESELASFIVENGDVSYKVNAHIGIYQINELGLDASIMFDRAHMALSTIKDQYGITYAVYNEDMRKEALWAQNITEDLPNAIYNGEILTYLQPIVDRSMKVVGAEALVRWNHSKYGLLPPISFIPTFERNGMISLIDIYMWEKVCQLLNEWKQEHPELFISVNISPKDFYLVDIKEKICTLAEQYKIDKKQLRLEITESAMITDVKNKIKVIESLREERFIIEMDDFGSGYSSLNLLKEMPVDVLKIDMGFLAKNEKQLKSRKIIYNIINMSKDLSIDSLTEGVEDEEDYNDLRKMNCQLFQGYFFARPMSIEEFEKYLEKK